MRRRNRWMAVTREIRLGELMKLVMEDEFVIIFAYDPNSDEYPEEKALFNGEAADWWKGKAETIGMSKMRVLGFEARELADTVGPGIMIVAEF